MRKYIHIILSSKYTKVHDVKSFLSTPVSHSFPGCPVSLLWNNLDCQFLVYSYKDLNYEYILKQQVQDNQVKKWDQALQT